MFDIKDMQDIVFEKSIKSFDFKHKEKGKLIYVILTNGNSFISSFIKVMTLSEYSHASISLDTSMNNMYSFSTVPLSNKSGFNRESIYSPSWKDAHYFDVFLTIVSEERYAKIERNINRMLKSPNEAYDYNFRGLVEYYLRQKDTKDRLEDKDKKKFFCSEFVQMLIDPSKNVLIAPVDIKSHNKVVEVGRYTPRDFSETKLIKDTKLAISRLEDKIEYESYAYNPFTYSFEGRHMEDITKRLDWRRLKKVYDKEVNDGNFHDMIEVILFNGILLDRRIEVSGGNDYTGLAISKIHVYASFIQSNTLEMVKKMNRSLVIFRKKTDKTTETYTSDKLTDIFDKY